MLLIHYVIRFAHWNKWQKNTNLLEVRRFVEMSRDHNEEKCTTAHAHEHTHTSRRRLARKCNQTIWVVSFFIHLIRFKVIANVDWANEFPLLHRPISLKSFIDKQKTKIHTDSQFCWLAHTQVSQTKKKRQQQQWASTIRSSITHSAVRTTQFECDFDFLFTWKCKLFLRYIFCDRIRNVLMLHV